MRFFWAVLLTIILLAGGVLAWRNLAHSITVPMQPRPAPSPSPTAATTTNSLPAPAPTTAAASNANAAPPASPPAPTSAAQTPPQTPSPLPSQTPPQSATQPPQPRSAQSPAAPKVHTPSTGALPKPPPEAAQQAEPAKSLPTDAAPKETTPLIPPTLAPPKIGDWDVQAATSIEHLENGALLFDQRFTVKGAGTPEDPYIVPWDLLTSAEETFEPSRGKRRIPERVAILHDKVIRIDGYVSFPLMSMQPKEVLVMLNMWDGCCIGVPPTPYDAVEVALKLPVSGDDRFAVSGKVEGKFKVQPQVVKTWLVSMYVMERAGFTTSDVGNGSGT